MEAVCLIILNDQPFLRGRKRPKNPKVKRRVDTNKRMVTFSVIPALGNSVGVAGGRPPWPGTMVGVRVGVSVGVGVEVGAPGTVVGA